MDELREAARLTGGFAILSTPQSRTARREALRDCARLEAEIARLRVEAAKEKQIPRQVDMNLELKRGVAARAAALDFFRHSQSNVAFNNPQG